jgi:segregation and condensation protein A
MTHTVAVGEFEGPLGLLLELVERRKIEVSSISVGELTATYLKQVDALQSRTPEELSEFLVLGARLVYIKSLALLPQDSRLEQGEELRQLNLELDEYKRMQEAARKLSTLSARRTWSHPMTERLATHDLPFPDVNMKQLMEAFTRALARTRPAKPATILKPNISLAVVVDRLRKLLDNGPIQLQPIIDACGDRLEIIVTFLALLEILKNGSARVTQNGQFSSIMVEALHA